jgi:uncharacterized membrane protein YhaH (DUF805 family)
MNLQTFTSFAGRIPRKTFWLAYLVMLIFSWLLMFLLMTIFGASLMPDPSLSPEAQAAAAQDMVGKLAIPYIILMLIILWPSLAVYTKRWHDRNKSGWWSLILFVPLVGAIWFLVELGFLRGTEGPNRYGPDPIVD